MPKSFGDELFDKHGDKAIRLAREFIKDGGQKASLEGLLASFLMFRTYAREELQSIRKELASTKRKSAAFKYTGVWAEGAKYVAGNFVTHAGSVWHANKTTNKKPGTCNDWTLAVKRGHDSR